jgi:hypothetical protein
MLLLLAWVMFGPGAWGYSHAQLGTLIQDAEMPTLAGGKGRLLSDAGVNVFIYFLPGQYYSRTALKKLAPWKRSSPASRSIGWPLFLIAPPPPRDPTQTRLGSRCRSSLTWAMCCTGR